MQMRFSALLLIGALGTCVALISSCGADRARFSDDRAGDGSVSGGGFDPSDGGATCNNECSSDLHSLLDCHGRVLSTCPPDQGCADGQCVAPCSAAAANKSSVGCDYYVLPPPFFAGDTACLVAFVANSWGAPVKLGLERGGTSYDTSKYAFLAVGSGSAISYKPLVGSTVPPGEVALVFLSQEENTPCPGGIVPATSSVSIRTTGRSQAFRLTTDAPVVAYDIFPYGGGSTAVTSATLLIPTSAWGDNYVGTTAYPDDANSPKAVPWMGVVASEDGTEVTVRPAQAIAGGPDVPPSPAATPVTFSLSRGQYVQLGQPADLTGSIIKANKPIGSWGGNGCAFVPAGGWGACDGMHQQIPPVRALGSRYAAVRYRNRQEGALDEAPPWRIVGSVDGTNLTYEPPQPGAPPRIDAGKFVMFNAPGPFVVRSQDDAHPFFFAGYMTGYDSGPAASAPGAGDPEFVSVIPPAQYLSSYIFFADPTYPNTNLVFVRKKGADGSFKDVTLDCAGVLSGWAPITDDLEYARADLVRTNFSKEGSCDNGRHEAKSTAPFGLTVWGWGSHLTNPSTYAVSYAYPAGAGVRSINSVVVPAVPLR